MYTSTKINSTKNFSFIPLLMWESRLHPIIVHYLVFEKHYRTYVILRAFSKNKMTINSWRTFRFFTSKISPTSSLWSILPAVTSNFKYSNVPRFHRLYSVVQSTPNLYLTQNDRRIHFFDKILTQDWTLFVKNYFRSDLLQVL